ncbi:MAG: hypothetical protein EP330_16760 [Deltaproteobacteria bacterium]|nr:MAG: hypothetical protein EP330_16760 [Deltaproteobacteria bacterium]
MLLLEWTDVPAPLSAAEVEEAMLGPAGLSAYLEENSAGALRIDGEVLGWRSAGRGWVDMEASPEEIEAVAREVFADLDVAAFDADENGRVDQLFVLHSARSPMDRPSPSDLLLDGRADLTIVSQVSGFGTVSEALPVGMIVHELGHWSLNQPDMYGNYTQGRYGSGIWTVMGLGGWGPHNQVPADEIFARPTHFHASAKEAAGWMEMARVTDDGAHQLAPIELGGGALRLLGPGVDLVLEVRGPTGFSAELPGHGLLIWREYWPDAMIGRRRIELVQADGRDDLANGTPMGERPLPPNDENFGDAGDPFPGAEGVRRYEDAEVGVILEDIHHVGEDVAFTVRWLDG